MYLRGSGNACGCGLRDRKRLEGSKLATQFVAREQSSFLLSPLPPRTHRPWPPVQAVHDRQYQEGNNKQEQCRLVCAGIICCLHLIVNINRDGARHARDIAAHHEYNSELAQRVREAERKSSDYPRL